MVLAEDIDAILPQTQCEECGYPGCLPYAQAISAGSADLNLCAPGGANTIIALGKLTNQNVDKYLDEALSKTKQPSIAVIREEDCIGCTKCISACPVDAIIGSAKHMHTIIDVECTGCGLCVEPCPVDCIDMVEIPLPINEYNYSPLLARSRYNAKKIRELREIDAISARYLEKRKFFEDTHEKQEDKKAKQNYILQALERAKKKHDNNG